LRIDFFYKGGVNMKKVYISIFSVALVALLTVTARAASNQGSGSQGTGQVMQGSGTTQPVQNQNQVQTQNQGEEQQLQVGTQEQQGTDTQKSVGNNSQGAGSGAQRVLNDSMSSVAQQVQKLLSTQSAAGGIGDQVREWAKTQDQSQIRIQAHVTKIESKTGLARSLFGPNYGLLNALKQEMQQNQVRVQQLEELKLKLTNPTDITNVQEMIALLQQESTALQEKISSEEAAGGVFGWLVKLFTE